MDYETTVPPQLSPNGGDYNLDSASLPIVLASHPKILRVLARPLQCSVLKPGSQLRRGLIGGSLERSTPSILFLLIWRRRRQSVKHHYLPIRPHNGTVPVPQIIRRSDAMLIQETECLLRALVIGGSFSGMAKASRNDESQLVELVPDAWPR
jgi:hypothetical protein